MRNNFLKYLMLCTVMLAMADTADAQVRRGRGRGTTPATQAPDTTQQQTVQQNVNTGTAGKYDPFGNLPIQKSVQTGGFNDTIKRSLRNDGATQRSMFKERIPLEYEFLRADDALYTQRVWREIDIREKINLPFRYQAQDDNGDQRFISILVKAVKDNLKNGNAIAFNADDDRFTTFLDSSGFETAISGGAKCDTIAVYDLIT